MKFSKGDVVEIGWLGGRGKTDFENSRVGIILELEHTFGDASYYFVLVETSKKVYYEGILRLV